MKDWHDILYVKNAHIYQPVLEAGLPSAPLEARGLAKIFGEYRFGTKIGRRPKVLDVSCGIGRHSLNLAKFGYETVGVDFSTYFLKTAQRLARQAGLKDDVLRFYEGDTKQIEEILESNGDTDFDAIICMDTSIVRSTLKEEVDLLRSLFRLGHKGSLLVIETLNRDFCLKNGRFFSFPIVQSFSEGELQRHLQSTYDPAKKHIKGEWRFFRKFRNGDLNHLLSVRIDSCIHSEKDLRRILEEAGWRYLHCYGSIKQLDKLTPDSFHIVAVSRKPH